MPLAWSDALELGLEAMDATHREFVDLLAAAEAADDASLTAAWCALVEHTEHHFGREDAWMLATGFSPDNCHTVQHNVVLQVLREGLARADRGDLAPVREMAAELGRWFPMHAQTMDAALALHLRSAGFTPTAAGEAPAPGRLPPEKSGPSPEVRCGACP